MTIVSYLLCMVQRLRQVGTHAPPPPKPPKPAPEPEPDNSLRDAQIALEKKKQEEKKKNDKLKADKEKAEKNPNVISYISKPLSKETLLHCFNI